MKNGKKHFYCFIKSVFLYPFFVPLKWLYKHLQRLMIRNARTNKISDFHNKTYHLEEETALQETSSFMVSCVSSKEQQEQLQPSLLLRQHVQGGGTPGSTPLRQQQQNVVLPMMLIDEQQSLGQSGSATKKKKKSPVSTFDTFNLSMNELLNL